MEKHNNYFDCIILGIGASGLSAGLYTQRANLSTLLIGKKGGSLVDADIENFFGLKEKTKGKILIDNTINNLSNLGAKFCYKNAIKIETFDNKIAVTTNSQSFECKYLILAIGKDSKGRINKAGISYCATCDGFFFKNKIVAVKGNNIHTLEDALYLKNICKKVYIFTDGEEPSFTTDMEVVTEKIKNITFENEKLTGVEFENKKIDLDGLFIIENVSLNSIQSFGIITKDNFIKVNENYQTNIKNVYAIGDIVGLPYQVAKAVYDGMVCGLNIIKDFNSSKNK